MGLTYGIKKTVFILGYLSLVFGFILGTHVVPLLFSLITFLLYSLIFGRIEYQKNLHDIMFYKEGEIPARTKTWFARYSICEIFIKSLVYAILPLFLFCGTKQSRIVTIAVIFTACVFFGYCILRLVRSRLRVDVIRWGYIRLALIIGILFSVLTSGVAGIGVGDLTWDTTRQTLWTDIQFSEVVELLYGLSYYVDAFISWMLVKIFGNIFGHVLGIIISTTVVHGFVILLYAMILLMGEDKFFKPPIRSTKTHHRDWKSKDNDPNNKKGIPI
jgi:hypothetical protein